MVDGPASLFFFAVGLCFSFSFSQLIDYDRHNNSLNKLREKKEKSLSDEKNLFKVSYTSIFRVDFVFFFFFFFFHLLIESS